MFEKKYYNYKNFINVDKSGRIKYNILTKCVCQKKLSVGLTFITRI